MNDLICYYQTKSPIHGDHLLINSISFFISLSVEYIYIQ